jgi:hypothetical protein
VEADVKTGRDLDVLIAEKLFSLKVDWEFDEPRSAALRDQYDEWGIIPYYSADVSDAWRVRDHMMTRSDFDADYFFKLLTSANFWLMPAEKAAETICWAALKAVGVEP